MNVVDSGRMLSLLAAEGYRAASSLEEADIVLLNTCCIREKADRKIYSELGTLRRWKRLRSGRLIAPLWMSTGEGEEFGSGKLGHRPSVSSLIYSDDHGESWHCGDLVARTTDALRYPSETAAVELSDGRVLFNMRTESDPHRRLVSISPDGVTAWSEPAFDDALL